MSPISENVPSARLTRRRLLVALAATGGGRLIAQTARQQVAVLRLELGTRGFAPASANVKAGKFLLVVNNNSGRKQLKFRVSRVAALPAAQANEAILKESQPDSRAPHGTMLLDLAPGEYIITEPGDPKLAFRLTVAG